MPTLLIRLKTGEVIQGKATLHALLCLNNDINPINVVACGIITKGRVMWQDRKPD